MTANQKQRTLELWRQGLAFSVIAEMIGLPKNTIKTFCWRSRNFSCDTSKAIASDEGNDVCRHCGKPLEQQQKQKPRRFCNDQCRHAWWRGHRDQMNRKALYNIVCANCGHAFESYGNSSRRYCCHNCYIAARFKSDQKAEAV